MFNRRSGNTSTLAVAMVVIVIGLVVLFLINSNEDANKADENSTGGSAIEGTLNSTFSQ